MNQQEYNTIWTQTGKALRYIRKKNIPYHPQVIKTDYEGKNLIAYNIPLNFDVMCHIHKYYPEAYINYTVSWKVPGEKYFQGRHIPENKIGFLSWNDTRTLFIRTQDKKKLVIDHKGRKV